MSEQEKRDPRAPQAPEGTHDGYESLVGRFLWLMVGPMLWGATLIALVRAPGWMTKWDPVYLGIVGGMVGGRYLEQISGKGTTVYGEPSTWIHYRSYVVRLLALSAIGWVSAKLIGKSLFAW